VTETARKAVSKDATARHLVILGPMGAGKTTIGTIVARRLDWPFVDSDRAIEMRHGRTGSDIAGLEGVARLHQVEADILDDAMSSTPPSVIAAAASVADNSLLLDRMASSRVVVVLLTGEAATLAERARRSSHRRHIGQEEAVSLADRRRKALEPVALATIDVTTCAPQEAAQRIERLVRPLLG
jgi:shikimate kinase